MPIERLEGITGSAAVKAPCRVATTAEILLSGIQTIDGIAVVEGDRVLVKDQTIAANNGIYIVDGGAWSRAPDFNGPRDFVQGTLVFVNYGTANGLTMFRLVTPDPITVGVTGLTFAVVDPVSGEQAAQRAEDAARDAEAALALIQQLYLDMQALYASMQALIASITIAQNGDYVGNVSTGILPAGVIWSDANYRQIPYASYWQPDLSEGISFYMELTGPLGLGPPLNPKSGQSGTIMLAQGAGGPHLITYASQWSWPAGASTQLSTVYGSIDVIWYTILGAFVLPSIQRRYGG